MLALGLALVGVGVVLIGPRLAVGHLIAKIADARTEAEETDALCTANAWVHRGLTPTYSVTCEDAEGHELRPWEDGRYDDVALVRMRWRSGQEVERRLLSTEPLGCVFGE